LDLEMGADAAEGFADFVFGEGSGSRSGSRRIIVLETARCAVPVHLSFYANCRIPPWSQKQRRAEGGAPGHPPPTSSTYSGLGHPLGGTIALILGRKKEIPDERS